MRKLIFIALFSLAIAAHAEDAKPTAHVVPHASVREFNYNGTSLRGVALPDQGAKEFEVWMASLPPGSSTPPNHRHDTEETFIFLKGKGKAVVDGVETAFEAPCTVILPANIRHHVVNTSNEPTQHIVIIGAGSKIYNAEGKLMDLPWRKSCQELASGKACGST